LKSNDPSDKVKAVRQLGISFNEIL